MKQDLAPAHELTVRRPLLGSLISGWRPPAIAAGLVLIVLLPFVAKNFFIFQLTLALIYAIAILGLNLLTGFNGQFSLGHSAFYAIGAYTAAILMDQADVPIIGRFRSRVSSAWSAASCSACRRCGSKVSISRWRPLRSRWRFRSC